MFSKLAVSFAAFLSLVNLSFQYTNITITSGGVARWFLVILPPKFDPWFPTPVILSYHGGVRNATQQMALDQIWNPVFNDFAITVYPQGINVYLLFMLPLTSLIYSGLVVWSPT
jgi:poly(3-hydroxybutyrate) depolymerase